MDHSAKEAIQQIKQKKYALRFKGKLGEESLYTGKILAVGIELIRRFSRIADCIFDGIGWPDRQCGNALSVRLLLIVLVS